MRRPIQPRTLFSQTLQRKQKLSSYQDFEDLNREFESAVERHQRNLYPSKKWGGLLRAQEVMGEKEFGNLKRPYAERALKMQEARTLGLKECDDLLNSLAPAVQILYGNDDWKGWPIFTTIYDSTYSTQGYGAHSYARGSALIALESATAADPHVIGKMIEEQDRCIVVLCVKEELDLEVLRRRPSISVKRWLQLAWKFGCNPRVFNPYLPQGLEDKLGLDYFGNEVKGA